MREVVQLVELARGRLLVAGAREEYLPRKKSAGAAMHCQSIVALCSAIAEP